MTAFRITLQGESGPTAEATQDWLFTFGFGHQHPNRFVRIHGTYVSAREEMVRRYGQRWAFQYPGDQADKLARHSITELKGG